MTEVPLPARTGSRAQATSHHLRGGPLETCRASVPARAVPRSSACAQSPRSWTVSRLGRAVCTAARGNRGATPSCPCMSTQTWWALFATEAGEPHVRQGGSGAHTEPRKVTVTARKRRPAPLRAPEPASAVARPRESQGHAGGQSRPHLPRAHTPGHCPVQPSTPSHCLPAPSARTGGSQPLCPAAAGALRPASPELLPGSAVPFPRTPPKNPGWAFPSLPLPPTDWLVRPCATPVSPCALVRPRRPCGQHTVPSCLPLGHCQ